MHYSGLSVSGVLQRCRTGTDGVLRTRPRVVRSLYFSDTMDLELSLRILSRQAIESGFVEPCAMCKGRPRRTGERVCGPVCRERERLGLPVQGSYYGVSVTRREPQTRPR